METFRLKSMVDFVLESTEQKLFKYNTIQIRDYANFLKQPLKLEMFVPCDEDGNVLEYPIDIYYKPDFGCQKYPKECYEEDLMKYEQAKEKVLFEGFDLSTAKYHCDRNDRTIEYFTSFEVELIPNAIKQLGL